MLALGIAAIGFERQGQWCQAITLRVRERSFEIGEKIQGGRIECFARAHHNAGNDFRAVFMQPTGRFELSLEQRTVESMLKITRAKCCNGFNNLESTKIGCVAHGWSPIAAP